MKPTRYLDTSIVLETVIKNAPEKENCQKILQAIGDQSQPAVISNFNISELFHILLQRENFSLKFVNDFIEKLICLPGLRIEEVSQEMLLEAINISTKFEIDLADACAITLMRKHKIKEIYARDEHFDRFKEIQRLIKIPVNHF